MNIEHYIWIKYTFGLNMMSELPRWRFINENLPQWSGDTIPPELGDVVEIMLNGWEGCNGKVAGYKVDVGECSSWLGVWLEVTNPPEWKRKEEPEKKLFYFVGCEIKYEAKPEVITLCNFIQRGVGCSLEPDHVGDHRDGAGRKWSASGRSWIEAVVDEE